MLRHGGLEIVDKLGEKRAVVEVVRVIIDVLLVEIHCHRILPEFRL